MGMLGLAMNLPLHNPDVDPQLNSDVDTQHDPDAKAKPIQEAVKVEGIGESELVGVVAELELMRAVELGVEGALDRLIAGHQADVRRMVGRLTAWGNDVDDLTQEVFLKAWKSARAFDARGSLRSWLLAIAVSQCRNHHRAATRFLNALTRLAQRKQTTHTTEGDYASNTNASNSTVDERWREVQRALNLLSSRDRELIVLVVMEQQPADEVAAMLEISTNNLYVKLHRAKARLTKLIQNDSPTNL